MKEFNLEEAKAGKPICTRDGCKARIICWDAESFNPANGEDTPIIALVVEDNQEYPYFYKTDGKQSSGKRSKKHKNEDCALDLMMACEKHEGWIIVCKGHDRWASDVIYDTKEEAEKAGKEYPYYVTTAKIEWEE